MIGTEPRMVLQGLL